MNALKTLTRTATESSCLGHEPSKDTDPVAVHFFEASKASLAENGKENEFKPVELLAALKTAAQLAPVMLELGILKSYLAAFYRAKGGYQLPSYYEPQTIPGLEDDNSYWPVGTISYNWKVEAIAKGPIEEGWLYTAHKFGHITKEGNFAKEGANFGAPASLSGMKKREGSDKAADDGKNKVGNVEKAKAKLGRPATSSGRKKRDVSDEALGCGGNDFTSKLRRSNRIKLSESQIAAEKKGCGLELDANAVKKGVRKTTMSREKEKRSPADCGEGKKEEKRDGIMSAEKKIVGSLRIERDDGKSQEQVEQNSSPRKMKTIKYLYPLYTDFRAQRNKELEAEPHKVSDKSRLTETMTTDADCLCGSPPILIGGESFLKKLSEEAPGNEISDKSGPQAAKQDQDSIMDSKKVKAPVNEVLPHIRSVALNPLYLKESNSLDMVEGFLSAFRSSIYCNGSNYETYKQHERGKRRKSHEFEPAPVATEQNKAADSSSNNECQSKRSKKMEEAHSGKPDIQQIVHALDAEEAFNQSQCASTFGEASVTYGFQHLSAETNTDEFIEILKTKTHPSAKAVSKIPEKSPDSQSSAVDVSKLEYFWRKLKELKYVIPNRFKLK